MDPSSNIVPQVSRLANGLTVATAEMPHSTSVSVGLWVGIGSRYEPASLNGICHFIEHLLFKGTARRTAREISQAVEGIGGYLNAFTSEETTCFHARAGYRHFELLLDVLLDMLLESKFAAADVDKEREVIKEEMAMYLDEPQHHVQELLNATMWPDQPLGRPITGTEATLKAMARRDLREYQRGNYTAGRIVIGVAGKVEQRRVVRAIGRYARHLPAGERSRPARARVLQMAPVVRLFSRPTEQTQLALGLRTCSRHDERRYALRLFNVLLGENMSSRLFQSVREDRALAYSIYSTPSFFEDTGDLVIAAGLETDKLPGALRLILKELRGFAESAPSIGELRRARDYVLGQIDLAAESTEAQMNWLGEQLLGYGRVFELAEIKRCLRRVTPGQIQAVARDFVRPQHLNLALVSPLKSDRGLAKLLCGR
jgi:predicted Zn-dependent peptidase